MKEVLKRFKSPIVITSLIALLYMVFAPSIGLPDWAEVSTQIVALIYALFGVTNNPTDKSNF